MSITRTPLVDDDGSGHTGTILNNAWQTANIYNPIDALIGERIPNTFNAANFSGSAGLTWTVTAGNVLNSSYVIHNKLMTVWLSVISTTIAGSGANLKFVIPAGKTSAAHQVSPAFVLAGLEAGLVIASAGFLEIYRAGQAPFAAVAGTGHVFFTTQFYIQ